MLKVFAAPYASGTDVGLVVVQDPETDSEQVGVEVVFAPSRQIRGQRLKPTIRLTRAAAQALFDKLYQIGFRPTSETD